MSLSFRRMVAVGRLFPLCFGSTIRAPCGCGCGETGLLGFVKTRALLLMGREGRGRRIAPSCGHAQTRVEAMDAIPASVSLRDQLGRPDAWPTLTVAAGQRGIRFFADILREGLLGHPGPADHRSSTPG